MKVLFNEITDRATDVSFSDEAHRAWVQKAVTSADESDPQDRALLRPQGVSASSARETSGQLSLRKVDSVVVVSGRLMTSVQLLCSRCAKSFSLPISAEFSSLFCKDPVLAGIAYADDAGRPQGQNHGFARHTHDGGDLDITYLNTDTIDLTDIVTEQVRLEVPFQPLCQPDCAGICPKCGTNWNTSRCACAKLTKESPFSALKSLSSASKSS